MRYTQLILATAFSSAALVAPAAAQSERLEFQCSDAYRIGLPTSGPNGFVQSAGKLDRMVLQREGEWANDDIGLVFKLADGEGTLVASGEELACESVSRATASAPAQRETETEKADRLRAQAESPLALPADSGSVAQDSTTIAVAPQPTEEAAIEDPTPPTPAIDEETQTASLQTDEPVAEVAAPALTGKSRGGRLRQGPGTGFDVAGTIREGTPVTILENAGNTLNGFDWFEIEYGDGQRAYTWGGILCTDGEKADGVFEVCG